MRSSGTNPAGNGRRIREEKPNLRAPRGEGPGKSGKANVSEPLINVVIETEPKALTGSSQKGRAAREQGIVEALPWTIALPAERRGLPRS